MGKKNIFQKTGKHFYFLSEASFPKGKRNPVKEEMWVLGNKGSNRTGVGKRRFSRKKNVIATEIGSEKNRKLCVNKMHINSIYSTEVLLIGMSRNEEGLCV